MKKKLFVFLLGILSASCMYAERQRVLAEASEQVRVGESAGMSTLPLIHFYNMKGLVSDKGEKKKAFYVVKKWYEGK